MGLVSVDCLLQVYVVYFKTNRNFIKEFPNMSNYVKDLYSNPGACSAACRSLGVLVRCADAALATSECLQRPQA